MDIWAHCGDEATITPLSGEIVRIVESQGQAATLRLVDTLAEQAQLEDLLEASKPSAAPDTAQLDYLLATPFRYPPLRHGSRFATREEPSLFYGARRTGTVLAEAAYYRLVFWEGMAQPPEQARLHTEHTVFAAAFRLKQGLRLQDGPFAAYTARISHPGCYADAQQLGHALREQGIEGFEYRSARDPQAGINLALFTPRALVRRKPRWQQAWLCETSAQGVVFRNKAGGGIAHFAREVFLVGGGLPQPAL